MAGELIRAVFGVLAVVFLLVPLVAILPLAFTSSRFLIYPIPSFSLRWFEELFTTAVWRDSIVNSQIIDAAAFLFIAGTVLLSLLILLARRRFGDAR